MRLRNWDRKVLSVSGNAKQVCLLESSLDHTDSWKRTCMQLIELDNRTAPGGQETDMI